MRVSMRKRSVRPAGPRQNKWKGARANQIADAQQQAHRTKLLMRVRRALRISGWIVGLAAAAWAVLAISREMGPVLQRWLEIREVQIEGIHHVTKQDVLDKLALKPGLALNQISASYLAERAQSHPWIKEASVERRPPHILHISVLERTPAAVVRSGSDHWLSDETGAVLGRLGAQDDTTLPLLTGVDAKLLAQGDARLRHTVQSAVTLARVMAHTIDGRVELDLTHPSNVVASTKGLRFQFGDDALVDQWDRFQKVKASLKTAAFEGKKREGSEVDLRYDNRVIVRERG